MRQRLAVLLTLGAFLCVLCGFAQGQGGSTGESVSHAQVGDDRDEEPAGESRDGRRNPGATQIKAAFLSKFGDFVEWPPAAFAGAGEPFVIGVLGAAALVAELERVAAGRTVQGRPITVRRLEKEDKLEGLHVLFIGEDQRERLPKVLGEAAGRALLTVTEVPEPLAAGSMINFVSEAGRVRFDIALPPAERSRLRISARLLAVARKVVKS